MNDSELDDRVRQLVDTIVHAPEGTSMAVVPPPPPTSHARRVSIAAVATIGIAASAAFVGLLAGRGDSSVRLAGTAEVSSTPPATQPVTTINAECPTDPYTLVEGDTAQSVAADAGVPVEVLVWANPSLVDAEAIVPGVSIEVPIPGCRYTGPPLMPDDVPSVTVAAIEASSLKLTIAPQAAWRRVDDRFPEVVASGPFATPDVVATAFADALAAESAVTMPDDPIRTERPSPILVGPAVHVVNLTTFDDSALELHYVVELGPVANGFVVTAIWEATWCRGDFFYEPGKPCT